MYPIPPNVLQGSWRLRTSRARSSTARTPRTLDHPRGGDRDGARPGARRSSARQPRPRFCSTVWAAAWTEAAAAGRGPELDQSSVETTGFEPATPALQRRCSTNWSLRPPGMKEMWSKTSASSVPSLILGGRPRESSGAAVQGQDGLDEGARGVLEPASEAGASTVLTPRRRWYRGHGAGVGDGVHHEGEPEEVALLPDALRCAARPRYKGVLEGRG